MASCHSTQAAARWDGTRQPLRRAAFSLSKTLARQKKESQTSVLSDAMQLTKIPFEGIVHGRKGDNSSIYKTKHLKQSRNYCHASPQVTSTSRRGHNSAIISTKDKGSERHGHDASPELKEEDVNFFLSWNSQSRLRVSAATRNPSAHSLPIFCNVIVRKSVPSLVEAPKGPRISLPFSLAISRGLRRSIDGDRHLPQLAFCCVWEACCVVCLLPG